MLLAKGAPAISQDILAARPMQILSVPEVDYFMNCSEDVQEYHWQGSFDDMRGKTFMILHTSGSTGIPKPVFVAHGTLASNDAHQLIPSLGGDHTWIDFFKNKRFFIAFPPFHAANLYFTISYNVFAGMTSVLPPPGPMTPDIVNKIHMHGNLDGTILPPSTITDIYNTSEYYNNMTRRLQFVAYAGGILSKEVGDSISSEIKLITLMGASELGYLPVDVVQESTAWQQIPISPFLGHVFRPSRDGLSELVIVRNPELALFQGIFSIFPNIHEYATCDLYEPDPKAPASSKSWVFRARTDDIISFSNAEKLNPVTMEAAISSHPAVNAALIAGQGEFQAVLLVEPKTEIHTPEEEEELHRAIWPTVMNANRSCPAHGRIMRDCIMFTRPGKPMPQAAKGTVQRYAALRLYDEEFKAFYASLKEATPSSEIKSTSAVDMKEPAADFSALNLSLTSFPKLSSEIDIHVEKVVHRLLPEVLLQHLGPAFARMITDLMHTSTAQTSVASHSHRGNANDLGSIDGIDSTIIAADGFDKADGVDVQDPTGRGGHNKATPTRDARQEVQDNLRHAIANNTYLHGLNDRANFFDCGLDSLQTSALIREINKFLPGMGSDVPIVSMKTVYENPTFEMLSDALLGFVTSRNNGYLLNSK